MTSSCTSVNVSSIHIELRKEVYKCGKFTLVLKGLRIHCLWGCFPALGRFPNEFSVAIFAWNELPHPVACTVCFGNDGTAEARRGAVISFLTHFLLPIFHSAHSIIICTSSWKLNQGLTKFNETSLALLCQGMIFMTVVTICVYNVTVTVLRLNDMTMIRYVSAAIRKSWIHSFNNMMNCMDIARLAVDNLFDKVN